MRARLLLVATALLLTVAVRAEGQTDKSWRDHLPAGWLAAVEAPDVDRLEAGVTRLLAPWGRRLPPLKGSLEAFCPGVEFTARPWGVALVGDEAGGLSPVLYLPTDDYDLLCERLKADRAGDLAVATVAGYDLALADRGGWTQIELLVDGDQDAAPATAAPRPPASGDLTLSVSPAGLERIAAGLDQRRRGQLEAGRGRIGFWRWPRGVDDWIDRLAPYAPFAEEVAKAGVPIDFAFDLREDQLRLRLTAGVELVDTDLADPMAVSVPEDAIAYARMPAGLPPRLVDLAIAWMRCRPDDIDAPDYPQPQWDDLAAAYRQLLSGYAAGLVVTTLPAPGEPVAANQAALFRWRGDDAALGDALQLVVVRWNQMVEAAAARSPLRIELTPLEDTNGWRLSTDLFEGFDLERSPEVEAIFDRYYGGDTARIDVAKQADGRWLVGFHDAAPDFLPEGEDAGAAEEGVLVEGELRVDRWAAWKQLIEVIDMEGVIGHKPRPPLAEAPAARLRVTGGETLAVEVTLPTATYDAAAAHYASDRHADDEPD